MKNATPLAVYIHWPFCKAKCPYCDFNSHVRENVEQERWKNALLRELETQAEMLGGVHYAASIFFGGGTPSLMPTDTVAALIARVRELFPSDNEPEVTLEANPTSVEAGKFHELRAAGVNRVSLGVQSLRPEGLAFLGRQHSPQEALAAVELAASIFPRYSFDLIYARPEQTVADWEAELCEALPYIGGHSSLYQLTIEEETPFARFHAAGDFALPEEDTAATLYEKTADILHAKGLLPYEISNYAKPGEECFHNLAIWRGMPYLGVGPGAHGRVELVRGEGQEGSAGARPSPERGGATAHCGGKEAGAGALEYSATRTLKSPERWLAQVERLGHGLEEATPVTEAERFEEQVMLGLRLSEGIDLASLTPSPLSEALLGSSALAKFTTAGVMETENSRIRLTPAGRLLLDYIVKELLVNLPTA